MRQTKVAVVLPSLVGGGAERVAIDLANHWSQQSREVTLITIDRSDLSHYPVCDNVRRMGLDLMSESRSFLNAIRNNLTRAAKLRAALRKSSATAVVSFTDVTNVTTLLACRGLDLRSIVCERTEPRHHRIGRVWSWLRRRTYGTANAIVVQTASVCEWAKSFAWKCPIVVIPNAAPVWTCPSPTARSEVSMMAFHGRRESQTADVTALKGQPTPERSHTIVALGRLSEEKGFHLLVEAFGRIASKFPDWQVKIFGEGKERDRLEPLIHQLQLNNRVHLPGWTQDVEAALRSAELFVLSSRYEGFPNALLEAMTIGLPCVSFDCDSGPREIIRHGIDGLLVPPGDVSGLAEALAELMKDEALRRRLSVEARQVLTRFSRDEFYRRWDAVLDGSNAVV